MNTKRIFGAVLAVCTLAEGGVLAQTVPPQAPTSATTPAPANGAAPMRIPDTLMFTIDELNEIQSHITGGNSDDKKEDRAIENATLFLSTILFTGPNDWTIWVNGKPISAGDELQAFKVTDISARSVELLVPLSARGMIPVRLSPNQTFVSRSGAVIEGRVK